MCTLNVFLFIPIAPPVIAGIAVLSTALVVFIIRQKRLKKYKKEWKDLPKIKMCALGDHLTGKTLWYDFLKTNTVVIKSKQNADRPYDEFSFKLKNGKEIVISKGKDITGDAINRKLHFGTMAEENDLVLFFINLKDYIENKDNREWVNSSIDIIIQYENDKKLFFLVLSHGDEACDGDREKSKKEFIELMNKRCQENPVFEKHYKTLLQNYKILDMTEEAEQEDLKSTIFTEFLEKI